jgi:signal transduction histidine kinase
MFSIKFKLLISFILVFGILIVMYSFYIYHRMRSAAIEQLDARIELFAERFESELDEKIRHHGKLTNEEIIDARKETLEPFQVHLADTTGAIVFSDSIFSVIEVTAGDSLNGKAIPYDLQTNAGDSYRVERIRIKGDRFNGTVCIAAAMTDIEANLQQLRWSFYITIPFAFILAVMAAYGITRVGFRSLMTLIESAGKINENNLDQKVPVSEANDEVRLLGLTFNNMIKRIAAAFQSQKQFIADVSHEFRTPLTIISSELEYARRGISKNKIDESIRIALNEIDHLKQLTNDLLLIAKLDSQRPQVHAITFRLDELTVDSVQKVTLFASEKGITFRLHIEHAIEFFGDKEKMESVIVNLLDNAIKYGKNKSCVDIHLGIRNGSRIFLSITNVGTGIPAEEHTTIFQRFYRSTSSRAEHTGSGLGLAIAKQIVELHSGTITVESISKKKTTFTVEIPFLPT